MKMKCPETAKRFVAYFDIMGFKDLVYRNDHSAVASLMQRVTLDVFSIKKIESQILKKDPRGRKKDFDRGVVLPVLFSDSAVFVSRSDSIFDARKAAYVASFFLYRMFLAGIPVKGALAYGTFTADFKKSKFFGRPLVDAYLLAEETNYYGAVLHHTFEAFLCKNKDEFPSIIIKRKPVPMKGGAVTHSFVDWRFNLGKDEGAADSYMDALYQSVSGSTRRYVDNTRQVYAPASPKSRHGKRRRYN